ncbi:hypothetical protein [Mesobacterium pallidum]|uniref:hypothetical protein n=1 Tax=Mesobacterium pallidum TaxID=2872037 RepID=UPI001EE32E46|nr:hypothetical protein [Mesobacterium pallidum]
MKRAAPVLIAGLVLTASAAMAALVVAPEDLLPGIDAPEPRGEVIEIAVPAADLERCQETVANVLSAPVDAPAKVFVEPVAMTAPTVVCVVE